VDKTRHVTLADLVAHVKHMADLLGTTKHIAIGTDMDGGVGRADLPEELTTSADLPRVADALAAANFSDDDVRGILAGNWLRFFRRALPRT
jgi:membrane dipeptidase